MLFFQFLLLSRLWSQQIGLRFSCPYLKSNWITSIASAAVKAKVPGISVLAPCPVVSSTPLNTSAPSAMCNHPPRRYFHLSRRVAGEPHFVITTNVDGQFTKAGFLPGGCSPDRVTTDICGNEPSEPSGARRRPIPKPRRTAVNLQVLVYSLLEFPSSRSNYPGGIVEDPWLPPLALWAIIGAPGCLHPALYRSSTANAWVVGAVIHPQPLFIEIRRPWRAAKIE